MDTKCVSEEDCIKYVPQTMMVVYYLNVDDTTLFDGKTRREYVENFKNNLPELPKHIIVQVIPITKVPTRIENFYLG